MTAHLARSRHHFLPSASRQLRRFLMVDHSFGLIDLSLAMVAIAMVFSQEMLVFLQITFLLLMLGACYWTLSGFIGRCLLWGGVATAELVVAVATGVAPRSNVVQWFVLAVMLGIVYMLVSRRNIVERTLTHVEQHDQLTRLPNRQSFLRRLDEMLAAHARAHRAIAVISIDLDDFTEVNRALRHKAADDVLVVVAERLRATIRATDTVARVGGDEFLIAATVDPASVPRIAERIESAIALPMLISGEQIRITASLGIALSDDPAPGERDELIRHADEAMRRVKSEGKAGFELFSPLTAAA